jgi:GGDEF domain-containing protein
MRVYLDKKTYVKIEYNKEKISLVTASPKNIGSGTYIIELLKDITDTGIIENIEKRKQEDIVSAINEINVSVSIGIYSCDDMQLTPEEVIYNVDKKLYMAKEMGRNRTHI